MWGSCFPVIIVPKVVYAKAQWKPAEYQESPSFMSYLIILELLLLFLCWLVGLLVLLFPFRMIKNNILLCVFCAQHQNPLAHF